MNVRYSVAAVALLLSGASAFAGDWNGFYAGLSVGRGSTSDAFNFTGTGTGSTDSGKGTVGGAQIGYNWQNSSILAGLEADYLFSGVSGSSPCPNPAFSCGEKVNGLGSVRGRLGWVVAPPALIYFTGGIGWANTQWSTQNVNTGAQFGSASSTPAGLVLGGGAEFKLAQHWSLKGEYLHYNFGKYTAPAGTLSATSPTDLKLSSDVFKLGLNYKF